MSLKIPIRATNTSDWTRKAADAVNQGISKTAGIDMRLGALETSTAAYEGTNNTNITALQGRAAALETFAHLPFTVATITLPPATLPASPVHGMLACDTADGKLKFYDGSAWQSLY